MGFGFDCCYFFFFSSSFLECVCLTLTRSERGNQRERDPERAQARSGHKSKQAKDNGLTPEQRRERDANALKEKAARKAAQAAAGGINAGGGGGKANNKK